MRFFIYNSTGNLQLILTKAYSARVTEELGKYDAFTADVPLDSISLDAIIGGYYVGVPIKDTNSFKLFKLERPSVGPDAITLTGIDAAAYDLKTQGAVTNIKEKAIPLENALDYVFNHTTWSYSLLKDDYDTQPLTFEAGSKKALLDQIKEQWGLTARFVYDTKNNKITNRRCIIGKKFERDTKKTLVRGRDAVNWKYDRDLTTLYSAILPIGDEVEESKVITSKTKINKLLTDSRKVITNKIPFGTETITTTTKHSIGVINTIVDKEYTANIAGISLNMSKGDPVNKPKGNLSLEVPDLSTKYAWVDNDNHYHPRMVVKKFDGYKDPHKLAIRAYKWLMANSKPKLAVTATADKIGNVELGDLVTVSDPHSHFEMKEPVSKIEHNLLSELDSLITVGTYSVKSIAARFHEQKRALDKDSHLKRHAIHKLRKKLKKHDQKLKEHDKKLGDLSDKLDGTGVMTDTTGRFAMHFDKDNPNKVLTATFNYDLGSKVKFDGNSFTMTDKDGGAIGDLDPTGLVTLAEADVGTVKTPQLIGEGDNSLITNYGAIGQIKKPIGKVYSAEFDPVQVWPSDGSVVDDPDSTASFQANHLEINQKVGTYKQSGYMTSSGLTFSYPIMDGSTGSHGNVKAVLTMANDDVPASPMLYLSKGDHTAELTPYGLLFDGQNILDKMTQVKLPDDMLTSKNLSTALNNLASGAIGGSKILTEQGLTDIFGSESSSGSYTPLVENLKDLILSKDFMDYICQELDAREYVKLSQVQSMLASSNNK